MGRGVNHSLGKQIINNVVTTIVARYGVELWNGGCRCMLTRSFSAPR